MLYFNDFWRKFQLVSILFVPLFLVCFLLSGIALGSEAKLGWAPNSETDLAGYKIHYGLESANYTNVVDVGSPILENEMVTVTLDGFTPGETYYLSATAYNDSGLESDCCPEVLWECPVPEPVNTEPSASNATINVLEDDACSGNLSGADFDNDALTYTLVSNGSLGNVIITNSATGSFTYTPQADVSGSDSFTFKVNDGQADSNIATVTVAIVAVNDVPSASNATINVLEDDACSGNLSGADFDNDALTYTLVSNGSLGNVIITNSATGSFTYTPQADVSGSDSFTFKVNDGQADSNIVTVTVDIEAVNDAPVAEDAVLTVNQGEVGEAVLSGSDIDNDDLTYTLVDAPSLGTVAIDADSGAYTYTPYVGSVGEDQFSFQVSDGELLSNTAVVSVTVVSVEVGFIVELGEVNADSDWLRVTFDRTFIDPVVVAKPAGNSDTDPCVVQIRNVDRSGFEVRLENWDYLAYEHGSEMVGFIVMERGSFVLPNGMLVEAGYFDSNMTTSYESVAFAETFNQVPVVAASMISVNEDTPVAGRLQNISVSGFNFRMQEQEVNSQVHDFETIAYIAWEPGSGLVDDLLFKVGQTGDSVTHAWFAVDFNDTFVDAPVLLADMQTTDGGDTSNLRYDALTAAGVNIKVSEEQSRDSEVAHITENIGFMVFDRVNLNADSDNDGLTFADEFDIYLTNPTVADSDGDGLADGDEVEYWGSDWSADIDNDGLVNLLDRDADGDGFADGAEIDAGYDPADAASWPGCDNSLTIEFGDLELDSGWQHVTFAKDFENPVVVARVVSKNSSDPVVVRVQNVNSSGFDLRLQEWDYLDDSHVAERVTYIVMESGSFTLDDGTKVEAGYFGSNAVSTYDKLSFRQPFGVQPVVMAAVATVNENDAVCGRIRKITTTDLEFKLQEQESNSKAHVTENIAYIAWEPSSGNFDGVTFEVGKSADKVKHANYTVNFTSDFSSDPILLTDMQTTDGGDTSVARCATVTSSGFEVFIEEEKSRDTEINHTSEIVGYVALW